MSLFIVVVLSCKNDSKPKASLENKNSTELNDECYFY